ncbi:MAG: immunoglobulin-like domain-containing protein [Candidatus Izemoplasmatales bacterium]
MKKFILLMMSFLFALIIVGCNGVTSSTTTEGTTQSTTESTTESSDTQPTSVTSDTDPVIEGAEDVTVEKNSSFIPLEGITAYDAEDGVIPTSEIQYSGNVNLMAVGEYEVSYTVVDNDGNVTTVYRTVTVVFTDTQGPLLAGVGPKTIYVGQDFDPTAGVSANDTIDGDVPVTYTGEVNIWEAGDYTLTYAAEDESANETTQDRVITVTFGDFVFGDATTYAMGDFTLDGTLYSSPAFSGGVINTSIADFTYIKVELTATGSAAGTINVNLNDEVSSLDTVDVSTTEATTTIYYVISESLTDVSFTVADDEAILTDFSVDISFAEVRDMVAPVLNVPTAEIAYPVNYTQAGLEAELLKYVTAVDDIDGNITSEITIDYGTLDLTTAGEYEVIYSIIDAGGNETNYTRNVVIGNLIDSGFISDPTFQNESDDQWIEKSNNGEASIAYDAVEGTMSITITKLGDWLSAAGTYLKEPTSGLEVDTWYMFTFTVKTTIDRKLGFRMGLDTDEANGWIDDFNGRSDMTLDINGDYQTFTFFFKLDSLTSTAGYTDYKIELNLGNFNYSNIGVDGITTFKDVYMYKVVTEYDPPTYTLNQGADLPIKFTVGDAEPTWANYINFYDMSMVELTPTIDASAVDMNTAGTYDVIFSATDSRDKTTSYTLQIEVLTEENADIVGPVVTIKDGVPTTLDQFTNLGEVQLHQLVDAVDAVDGVITVLPEMVDDGGLDFNVAGTYTITFTVYDLSGNETVEEFVVTINDKEAPVIGVNDFTVNLGDPFDPLFNVTVNDNVDGVLDPNDITITGLDAFVDGGYVNQEGKFDLTYEIADAAGNVRTKIVAVEVISIEWDESTRTALGTPDGIQGVSTVTYDPIEEADVITGMVYKVNSWERERWTYLFDSSELVYGRTYKFEITVKADVATELMFRIGATLGADPWIDNYTGGLRTISIGDTYTTYEVIFTVDKEILTNTKFEFTFGNLPADDTNTIYIQDFDLVQEVEPEYTLVQDLLMPDEIHNSNISVDFTEEAYVITDLVKYQDDWDTGRLVYYLDEGLFTLNNTYRIIFTIKADTATELHLRIGSTLWVEPWIDDFTGGLKTIEITDEYATYEMVFTADKAIPNGNVKFQFQYGYLDTDNGNVLYLKDFALEELVVEADQLLIDDFTYADETAFEAEWTERTNGTNYDLSDKMNLDENGVLEFVLPETPNGGWILARKYDTLASFGVTDEYTKLAFYITNDTNVTSASVWLYWSGSQNAYPVTLPAIGESGWVVIDVTNSGKTSSEITDFAFGFNNWAGDNQVNGSYKIHYVTVVKAEAELEKIVVEEPVYSVPEPIVIDDFDYTDETAFEAEWTERTNGVDATTSTIMDLDATNNTLIFTLPETANNGWILSRKYDSLSSLGGVDGTNYLAFMVTNNTNVTSAYVWLYWSDNQNSYPITLPAIGETGWAYIDITGSEKVVSEITDFAFGFNNWSGDNQVTGSYSIHRIVMVEDPIYLLGVTDFIFVYNDFESYADDTAYQADTTDNIVGTRISSGDFVKTKGELIVDGDNNYLIQDVSSGTNGIKIKITQDDIPSIAKYIAIYIQATNTANMTKFQAFRYTAAGVHTEITSTIIGDFSELGNGTFVFIPVSSIAGDTAVISLVVNCATGVSGQLIFDHIVFTQQDFIVIPEDTNNAPEITISDENLAAISGMTLVEGTSIESLLPDLLAMIEINDAEDGVITTTQGMFDFGTLNPANPLMGTYEITVNVTDSEGLAATPMKFTIDIVNIVENFESYTDDADFKANWPRIESFRVSGGSWGLTAATLTTDGDNNLLEFTYGPSTNGIKFDVTKAELVALGAEYIGIYVKTSAELVGTSNVFQAFHYVGGTFVQVTTYGTISYTDEGTYFYIKVSDLPEGLTQISLMINLASGNTGTMTMDNIVVK